MSTCISEVEQTILFLMSEALLCEKFNEEEKAKKIEWGVNLLKKFDSLCDKEKRFE